MTDDLPDPAALEADAVADAFGTGVPDTDAAAAPDALSTPDTGTADADAFPSGAGDPAPEEPARAPMGSPAEPETPQHTADPEAATDGTVEDSLAYELAVEDGAGMAPGAGAGSGHEPAGDSGADDAAPRFREPDPA